jgi:hypothetical protein
MFDIFSRIFNKSNNVIVFKTSYYDLGFDERRATFKDYNNILCEKCNQKVNSKWFYCEYCYRNETSKNEKNRILHGKCKQCFEPYTGLNWCTSCELQQDVILFKTSDYYLNLDERTAKFKTYNNILCEKCKLKVYNRLYCRYCYDNETNEILRNRMQYGECKKCFQSYTSPSNWCSCNKTSDDEKRKDIQYGRCGCSKNLKCLSCRFRQDFDKWTSGNKNIDELIQDTQGSARDLYGILEWIQYDRFTNIKYIAEGGFAKVCSATWEDGYIMDWKDNNWIRKGPLKVALKVLNDSSESISEDFLNEVFIKKYNKLELFYLFLDYYNL